LRHRSYSHSVAQESSGIRWCGYFQSGRCEHGQTGRTERAPDRRRTPTRAVPQRIEISMKSQRPGKIVTFYSYKGGTGRSMALANVAWLLASAGNRVLVIDWDLEAPGLHRYFEPFLEDKGLESSTGVIDFVLEFATAAVSDAESTRTPNWFHSY